MVFLTRRTIRTKLVSPSVVHTDHWVHTLQEVPRPRGLGMLPMDVLVITLDRIANRYVPSLVDHFAAAGFVARGTAGTDHDAEAEDFLGLIRKSRAVMYMSTGPSLPTHVRYAWQLGALRGADRPVCLLPVFSGRFSPDTYTPEGMWAQLPIVGTARSIGDDTLSLWVVKSGGRRDSDGTVNFDYWLRHRFEFV